MRTSELFNIPIEIKSKVLILKSDHNNCHGVFDTLEAAAMYAMRGGGEFFEYKSPETLAYFEMSAEDLFHTKNIDKAVNFIKNTQCEFIVKHEVEDFYGFVFGGDEIHYYIEEVKLWARK